MSLYDKQAGLKMWIVTEIRHDGNSAWQHNETYE